MTVTAGGPSPCRRAEGLGGSSHSRRDSETHGPSHVTSLSLLVSSVGNASGVASPSQPSRRAAASTEFPAAAGDSGPGRARRRRRRPSGSEARRLRDHREPIVKDPPPPGARGPPASAGARPPWSGGPAADAAEGPILASLSLRLTRRGFSLTRPGPGRGR